MRTVVSGVLFPEQEWRGLLSSLEAPSVFQTPEMARVYVSTDGYHPVVGAKYDQSGGLAALLLGYVQRLGPAFPRHLVSWAIARGGPLPGPGVGREMCMASIFDFAAKAKSRGAIFSRVYRSPNQAPLPNLADRRQIFLENSFDYILDLTQSREELRARMKRDRQKNISRAEREGLVIERANSAGGIETLRRLYEVVARRAGLIPYPQSFFSAINAHLLPSGFASVYLCRDGDVAIAARCVLHYRSTAIDWIAGASETAGERHANEYLIWRIIGECQEKGFRVFEFGGAGTGSNLRGLAEFKRRFGGELVNPGRYLLIHRPLQWRLLQTLRRRGG